MHYKCLVTTDIDNASSSDEVRRYVTEHLIDEGWASGGERWGAGPADWFLIGGLWSRSFASLSTCWGKAFEVEVERFLKANYPTLDGLANPDHSGDETRRLLKLDATEKVEAMWAKARPSDWPRVPYVRDSSRVLGYEDDAQLVTQALYDAVLKPFEGTCESGERYVDLEFDAVSPSFVRRKWVVVVDNHI
jgi:hypothetical protein